MVYEYTLQTQREGFYDITKQVREAVAKSGIGEGLCAVHCPHTTAAVTVNEGADPDVTRDLLFALGETFSDRPQFRHCEGNSAAHLKSSCVGCTQTLIVKGGQPLLGRWQSVYFCEFDGPRSRSFFVKTIEG